MTNKPTKTYLVFIGLEAVFESLNVPSRKLILQAEDASHANELAEAECVDQEYVLEVTRVNMEK